MLADFQAVAELGWIAGSGVLLCALSCFTVLPAMLCVFDRRCDEVRGKEAGPILSIAAWPPRRVATWLPALARRPWWVMATGLALTAGLGVFAFRITYDHNLLHLQARGLDSVKWELTLIKHTAGANWHAVSYRASPQEALALKARYEKLKEVSRVVEVASLVPPAQDGKLRQLRDIRHRLRFLPPREAVIRHPAPHPAQLRKQLDRLLGKLRSTGFVGRVSNPSVKPRTGWKPVPPGGQAPVVESLHGSLTGLKTELASLKEEVARRRLQQFEERLSGDLVKNLHELRDVSTPRRITLDDLPPSLRNRYVGKSGQWLLRVFARDCLWDHAPLQRFVDQVRTVDAQATGKPFVTLEGLKSLRSGFQWAALYALVAIVLIFLADFRRLRHALWALVPLAMGVVISLGIMGLFGLPVNPANVIAFPLILGVGAVYGVHVVHDYLAQGAARNYTLSYIIGRAILVMALTNMISFSTLMISRHRGLSGLGFTLLLGVSCCMVTALVFLPALLRVVSGRKPVRVEMPAGYLEERRMAA
jgi:predicted RND superfamily exporter protein